MFIALALLTTISAVSILVAGSLALLRNSRLRLNQAFFFLTLSLALWLPFNFLGSNVVSETWTAILVKFDFSFAIFIVWFMLYFASFLMGRHSHGLASKSKPFFISTLVLNLSMVFAIMVNLVFVVQIRNGDLIVENSTLYPLYIGMLLFYILFAFKNFLTPFLKLNKSQRRNFNLIMVGLFFAAFTNVLTNIVFPSLFQSRQTVQALNIIGYLGIVIFVGCLYVSITTRRLFDIRLVIARSLAYIFSLTVLAGFYGILTNAISNSLNGETTGTALARNLISTLLIIFTALSYLPLKKAFDRMTNRYFYRDAYDPQKFLNDINAVLVSTIELNTLLEKSARIIESTLKSEYCFFGIKETESSDQRIIGNTGGRRFTKDDIVKVRSTTPFMGTKLIVSDELEGRHEGFKKLLAHHDIAVLSRLVNSPEPGQEGIGYLVLGVKKSGSPYNKQDLRVIDIISNELVIAIQNALRFEEIEKFNVTLQEKIEDATRRLQRTNEKLKALDETKDEFISMASHQLRTPLTSVKGYLSMVLEGDAGKLNDMQHKLLDQAFVSSQRMVYLIADLLNVSRLKTGKFVIEAVPSSLAELVEGEVNQLIDTAKGRGLTLSYQKPKDFPLLMLDETKVRQVVMNFTDNAIYYTPTGGHIILSVVDKKDSVEFTVSDDGIGVPKHEQHHLFSKFYRAGNAKKARPDGTGLGLFMAQKVIVAQGGGIIFHSEEGKGSTFGFTFAKSRLKVPDVAPTEPVITAAKV